MAFFLSQNAFFFDLTCFCTFFGNVYFDSGAITNVEVVDGGLICSSGVLVEEMGDKNEECYIVNAAVYVGY